MNDNYGLTDILHIPDIHVIKSILSLIGFELLLFVLYNLFKNLDTEDNYSSYNLSRTNINDTISIFDSDINTESKSILNPSEDKEYIKFVKYKDVEHSDSWVNIFLSHNLNEHVYYCWLYEKKNKRFKYHHDLIYYEFLFDLFRTEYYLKHDEKIDHCDLARKFYDWLCDCYNFYSDSYEEQYYDFLCDLEDDEMEVY